MNRIGNFACSIIISLSLTAGSALGGVVTPNPSPEVKITGVVTPNPEPPPPPGITFQTDPTASQTPVDLSLFEYVVIILSNMGSNLL